MQLLTARDFTICRLEAPVALGAEMLQIMGRLPMLHSLTLRQCGVRTLPQLLPLTFLSNLCELHILDSPVTRLVLLRPFIAAILPRVVLLNGETQDTLAQQSGMQCFAPLLQELWDSSPDRTGGERDAGDGRKQLQTGGWGLSQVAGILPPKLQGDSQTEKCSVGDSKALDTEEDSKELLCLVDNWVDSAVAHAVDVEHRWQCLEECWDSIVCEVLQEWTCFSDSSVLG